MVKRSTCLLDLNDDCLSVIFEYIAIRDLFSIAQTSSRLNALGCQHFHRYYKICNFKETEVKTAVAARKFFEIFGAGISELDIDCSLFSEDVMGAVIKHCSTLESLKIRAYKVPDKKESIAGIRKLFENLKKLHMEYLYIDGFDERSDTAFITPNGNLLDIFVNCKSLISLVVFECDDLDRVILASAFPQLQNFKYFKVSAGDRMDEFFLRHENLKSVSLDSYKLTDYDAHIPALQVLAANCKQLEKLKFGFGSASYNLDSDTDDYEMFLDNLSKLPQLTELKVIRFKEQIEEFAAVLPNLRDSLEVLHLKQLDEGHGLIEAVRQLKKLRVLTLQTGYESDLENIDPLGELESLNELSIEINFERGLQFDFVKMVCRLVNLTKVKFDVNDFKIDNGIFQQLVAAVESRPDVQKRTLQIDCRRTKDFIDSQLETVKFIQFE